MTVQVITTLGTFSVEGVDTIQTVEGSMVLLANYRPVASFKSEQVYGYITKGDK
jgi:hypothetical protein